MTTFLLQNFNKAAASVSEWSAKPICLCRAESNSRVSTPGNIWSPVTTAPFFGTGVETRVLPSLIIAPKSLPQSPEAA